MDARRPERTDEDDELAALMRLDWAYSGARRQRAVTFTVAALLGVVPWLRSLRLSFIPEALAEVGVIFWGVSLILALALAYEERGLKRDLDRCAQRLARRKENPLDWRHLE